MFTNTTGLVMLSTIPRYFTSIFPVPRIFLLASMMAFPPLSLPATEVGAEPIFATGGVALSGYDVVAYFTDADAVRGDPVISHRWQGVDWFFSSDVHRALFVANPELYMPLYGGFCGIGAAHGGLVPSSPTAWTVHEGKLVLNMNQQVAETWRYNPNINIERADRNWPAMRERYIASQAQP